MSKDKKIERWGKAVTAPRDPNEPWTLGSGGSFDTQEMLPIPDDMLVELAEWMRMGYTPWNGRSMPLSDGDREFMYLLYYSAGGLVARMRQAEKRSAELEAQLATANAAKPRTLVRQTHTYAGLGISATAYDEIASKLVAAGYGHAFDTETNAIDMSGIGVMRDEPAPDNVAANFAFDEDNQIVIAYGTRFATLFFQSLSAVTPPDRWLRVTNVDNNGVVTVEARDDLVPKGNG